MLMITEEEKNMTKKELMHQIYILAKKVRLIKNVTESYYSKRCGLVAAKRKLNNSIYIFLRRPQNNENN